MTIDLYLLIKQCKAKISLVKLEELHQQAKTNERKMAIETIIKNLYLPRISNEFQR